MKNYFILLFSIFLFQLSACTDESDNYNSTPLEFDMPENTLSTKAGISGQFLNLTQDACMTIDSDSSYESKNFVISPLSVHMLLSMIANGLDNEAKTEIADYLGINDLESLNEYCKFVYNTLPSIDNKCRLSMANSIWYKNGLTINSDYSNILLKCFDADIFANQEFLSDTKNSINNWISNKTGNNINNYYHELNPNSFVAIINTIMFNAAWSDEYFDINNTNKSIFYGLSKTSEVNMMNNIHTILTKYDFDDKFEYFYLTFGRENFYISFLIPKESISMDEAIANLKDEYVSFKESSVTCFLKLHIPRFEISSSLNIVDILAHAGLNTFKGNVELPMFEENPNGSFDIKQSTSFSLDESGVKFVTASSGTGGWGAAMAGGTYEVWLNRPFFFFINERETGAYLVSGRVTDL